MKNFFTTNVGSHTSSSKLFKFLFLIVAIIIPMIVIWVVLCEFNEVGLNWMVPVGGKFFINEHLLRLLHDALGSWQFLPILAHGPAFVNWIPLKIGAGVHDVNQNVAHEIWSVIPNFGKFPVVSGWPFLIMVMVLVADVIFSLIFLFFTRFVFLDIYPNLFSTWLVLFLMVTSLIMPWNRLGMTIPVTIIVMVLGWVISFIILNAIFNRIILNSRFASLYYADLLRDEKIRRSAVEEPYRREREKLQGSDLEYVEIEEKEPKHQKKKKKKE